MCSQKVKIRSYLFRTYSQIIVLWEEMKKLFIISFYDERYLAYFIIHVWTQHTYDGKMPESYAHQHDKAHNHKLWTIFVERELLFTATKNQLCMICGHVNNKECLKRRKHNHVVSASWSSRDQRQASTRICNFGFKTCFGNKMKCYPFSDIIYMIYKS